MLFRSRGRTESLANSYLAQGVTFDFAGEERPFPLDAVPRVIDYAEWSEIEAGVKQRVRALEADTPQAALVDTCRTLKLSAEGARKLAEHLEDLIQAHAHESGDDAQPFVLRLALAADPT